MVEAASGAVRPGPPLPRPLHQISGRLFFSQDGKDIGGLNEVRVSTGELREVGRTGVNGQNVGLCLSGEAHVLFGSRPLALQRIRIDGGGASTVGGGGAEGLAYGDGVVYACINGDFHTLNRETGLREIPLPPPGGDAEGLAYGSQDHVVYGILSGGTLKKYDIATQTWSTVGSTGINFDNTGLAYDPATHTLYAKRNGDVNLYRIDPDDASAEVVGSTGVTPGGGMAFLPDAGTCHYTFKKVRVKKKCESCPEKGTNYDHAQSPCGAIEDCSERFRAIWPCPDGRGKCKIKAERTTCESW